MPRTRPEAASMYTLSAALPQSNYDYVSGAPGFAPELASCWQPLTEAYYPGNDSAYIPTSSVAPTELAHPSYWEAMAPYNVASSSTSSSSSGSSTSTKASISPRMSEVEVFQSELYPTSGTHLDMDHFPPTDPWTLPMMMPPTPPADPMFDNLDLFNTSKDDAMAFMNLPDSAYEECEYLGPSKLQFSRRVPLSDRATSILTANRGPVRHQQPRPIRSASERSPPSSTTGSPKDEPVERTKNNPRNDPRYDVKPDKAGLYHCPYVGTEGCTHKPTKQKCIYAYVFPTRMQVVSNYHLGRTWTPT